MEKPNPTPTPSPKTSSLSKKDKIELGKIDPKCWLCATLVTPPKPVQYRPLICSDCLPGYKERKFVFVRASQQELDELFPIIRPLETLKLGKEEDGQL
jgi:hypothetical protein